MSGNERYLVTGATGKTGAHAVKLLREQGAQVRALVHRHEIGRASCRERVYVLV